MPPLYTDGLKPRVIPSVLGSITDAAPALQPLVAAPTPQMTAPVAPSPTLDPRISAISSDPLITRKDALEADLYKRSNPVAPASALGKIGHVAAGIGNVLGDIFAPDTMALIPGTQLHNERIRERDQLELQRVSNEQTAGDQRKQTEATTAYTGQRADLDRAKLLSTVAGKIVPKGFKTPTFDANGDLQIEEDPESQHFKDAQALDSYRGALQERAQVQSDNQRNHYVPGTPQYEENQRKLAQIDTRLHGMLMGLGLQQQRVDLAKDSLAFNEDKNYNPEPTSTQKSKADLASSAVERIAEMKAIVARHPEAFGPGAGRAQNAQNWLGSSDPDAATYQAAAQYLADHSAGVFGGRGQYIMSQLHSLTDPKYNPEALNATLDEAHRAAQGFIKAGAVHAKGHEGSAASGGVIYARDTNGQLHQAPAGTELPQGWKEENK